MHSLSQFSSSLPAIRHKRRLFSITLYGVPSDETATSISVTQDTTACEAIHLVLQKGGMHDERVRDYIVVEDVQRGWERQMEGDERRTSQRILDMDERVLLAENKWKGCGRFVIKKTNNDPGTRAWLTNMAREQRFRENMEDGKVLMQSGEWDKPNQQMFLVCIFNVSVDQPYTIMQAPRSSTAQDIITQIMMKARRPEEHQDPRHYVLLEELYLTSNFNPKHKHNVNKQEKRILPDDEIIHETQMGWQSNAGKLLLYPRHKAVAIVNMLEKRKHEGKNGALQKLNSMFSNSKEKREKHTKVEIEKDPNSNTRSPPLSYSDCGRDPRDTNYATSPYTSRSETEAFLDSNNKTRVRRLWPKGRKS